MDSSKKNNTAKVNPEVKSEHAAIKIRLETSKPNEGYWSTEFGNFEEIKDLNALCQLFKDPPKVKKMTVKDIKACNTSFGENEKFLEIMKSECILHRACFASYQVFEYLVKKLKLPSKPLDIYRQTPLHFAAFTNNPEIIKFLMDYNDDYNGNEETLEKHTPAHYAAFSDSIQCLEILNNHGCDMNREDIKGRTPLTLAIHFGKRAAMKFLLGLEIKINYKTMLKLLDSFPNLAASILYKKPFRTVDNEKGRIKYDFSTLFPKREYDDSEYLPSPLAVVVKNKSLCIVESDTFQEYIKTQWEVFGRKFALTHVFINVAFVLVWTSLGIFTNYETRGCYTFPADIWRVIFLIIAGLGIGIKLILEWNDYQSIKDPTKLMDIFWFYEHLQTEDKIFQKNPNNTPPQEENTKPSYCSQKWNIIDIASITMQIMDLVCEIVLIFENIGRIHNYIVCANITLLWISLLKTFRPFRPTGTLVVSLSKVVGKDLCRFSVIFMVFLLPMSFNFWMTFGGREVVSNNLTTSVDYYDNFFNVFFSVFRIAVVDEYDYNNMKRIEPIFTELLITLWISMAAILLVNLFIALLTDTFQRVYDNTNLTITLEKARYLAEAWNFLQKHKGFLKHLNLSKEKMKINHSTDVDFEFTKPNKLHNILTNIQEYLSINEQISDDIYYIMRDMQTVLKEQNIARTKKTDTDPNSQKSVVTKSTLQQNINTIKKDLRKLLHHLKDSRSENIEPSTSTS